MDNWNRLWFHKSQPWIFSCLNRFHAIAPKRRRIRQIAVSLYLRLVQPDCLLSRLFRPNCAYLHIDVTVVSHKVVRNVLYTSQKT